MTSKPANRETDALTTPATTEHQELTPNELATIHGARKAGGKQEDYLIFTMKTGTISSY
jgi:hypothetical protein